MDVTELSGTITEFFYLRKKSEIKGGYILNSVDPIESFYLSLLT